MSIFGKESGKPKRGKVEAYSPHLIRARYDVAQRTSGNEGLWRNVDGLSAAAANNPSVRKRIRDIARYEVSNNSYAAGIVDTFVSDIVGPWVTLQLPESPEAKKLVSEFNAWAENRNVRLWEKIRTMIRSRVVDGESFAMFTTNKTLGTKIKLNLVPIECDMVESWFTNVFKDDEIDGIRFSADKIPVEYRILKYHPGDHRATIKNASGEWVPAKYVVHFFNATRPGQVRGVSALTPCLSLFAQMRGYTVSVLETAARAAEIAGIMQTDLVPESEDSGKAATEMDPFSLVPANRNTIMSLPEGWRFEQVKAEQPTTTYAMFKREILCEIARCLPMPYNVAAGDSSSYNYASGRLDHQTYDRSIEIWRADLTLNLLNETLSAFLDEYAPANQISEELKTQILREAEWYFTSRGHVDPAKEANADDTRLKNGTLSLRDYYARQGINWRKATADRVDEMVEIETRWNEARKKAGLPPAPFPWQTQGTTAKIDTSKGSNDEETQ